MSRRYSGAVVAGLLVAMVGCKTEEDASRLRNVTAPNEPSQQTDRSSAATPTPTKSDSEPVTAHGSVRERVRMIEDDRSWMKANPNDHLASVEHVSGDGGHLHLTGSIAAFEGQSMIALVNVSHDGEPLVLQKWFESGGGSGIGKLDVVVDIPQSVTEGDCLAVKNVGGGRGFTDDEIRMKEEFGAFLYAFTGPKVFRTAEECLEDAAANRSE